MNMDNAQKDASTTPLAGVRVLDFGWVYAAPTTGLLLADMGAEVIKIETRTRLDASRRGRPLISEDIAGGDQGDQPDLVPLFHNLNRGKLSLTIDLNHQDAPAVLDRLVAASDVTVDNFTPRAKHKLGLTYERLSRVNPKIIVASLSVVGQYGPLRDISGYAPTVTSLVGMEGMVGYPGQQPIGMLGLNFSDPTCGMFAYLAIVLALWRRRRTGKGLHIDLAQTEAITSLLDEPLMDYLLNGRVAVPRGNYHPQAAPYGTFPTAEEDRWVAVAVGGDPEWKAFASVVAEPWTADDRFASLLGRLDHREALEQHVAAWTSQRSVAEVVEPLQEAGVAAMPVMNIEDQFSDPHHQARDMYAAVDHPKVGYEPIFGLAWKFSDTPGRVERPAPLLGEHNDYVLGDLLGYATEEIREMEARGIIA